MTGRARLALLLALWAGGAAFAASRFDLATDVTRLMPQGRDSALAAVSRALATSAIARTMVLSISAPELPGTLGAARSLAGSLRAHPAVESVRAGVDETLARAAFELYFPRRHAFLADDPDEIEALLAPEALAARARAARAELAMPMSLLTARLLPEDPLGAFPRLVARLQAETPGLVLEEGQLVTPDRRFAIVFVTTRESGFDGEAQAAFLRDLDGLVEALRAAGAPDLVVESAGANRFAVAAERSIRGDVQWLAMFSAAGVVAIFLLAFRSFRSLALAALPVVSGLGTAICFNLAAFGRLDGLTLGFGAALIGVVIDHPVVLLAHARAASTGGAAALFRRVGPGILLGGLTTVASFAGLGLTTIPGLQQLAAFSAAGVLGAVAVTLLVLPPLVDPAYAPQGLVRALGVTLERAVWRVARARRALGLGALAVTGLSVAALPGLRFTDDPMQLWRLDPDLVAEDARVRERVGGLDAGRFAVVSSASEEETLVRNDELARRLDVLREAGALEGFRSLHAFLFSASLQEANEARVRATPDVGARVRAAFAAEGFRPDAFEPFERALARPPPTPLALRELLASPLSDGPAALAVPFDGGLAALTALRGVRDEAAIRAAVDAVPGAHLFDQRSFLFALFTELRITTFEQIGAGGLLVLLPVLLRYRRIRPSLAAFAPCGIVTLALLGTLAVAGIHLNFLHAVGIVLITGIGVDYSVFVVDAVLLGEDLDATLVGLVVSCLTTVFAFGILALSEHPALRAIGITVGVGVLLSLLSAPLSLLLVGDAAARNRA